MILTKRQAIDALRLRLKELNADSIYTRQKLYATLIEQGNWLVKREISGGRVYRNAALFQNFTGRDVVEVSTVPSCINIKNRCKIYRTKVKLPEMWIDNNGPVIKDVTSVDGSTSFTMISAEGWQDVMNDPYQKFSSEKYCFYADGYLWFPKDNPHRVNIRAYFKDDIRLSPDACTECDNEKSECIKFLDTKFMVPDWILAELYHKAAASLMPSKQMPEDVQIDKNTNRKS